MTIFRALAPAVCALLTTATLTQAATFRGRTHFFVLGGTSPFDETASGDSSLAFGPVTGSFDAGAGRIVTANGSVTGTLDPNHILGLYAATDSNTNIVGFIDTFGAYRDIVSLSGSGGLPSTIRLTFAVHFSGLTTGHLPGFDGNTQIAIGFQNYNEQDSFAFSGAQAFFPVNSASTVQGFESSSGSAENFSGTLSSLAFYNSGLGGYAFQIVAATSAASFASSSVADASNTVSLVSVTNADGSPLSGLEYSFASGLQATPEPATFLAVPFGLAITVMAIRRRRH